MNKEVIANIFIIPNIENMGHRITYDSHGAYYLVKTHDGEVKFHRDEMGLPYIDDDKTQGMGEYP